MLKKLYNFSNSWTGTIFIVLMIIFFIAQAFVIPSGSMKRTLLIGDHLFVKKFAYGIPTPHIPWIEVPVLPDFAGNGHLITGEGPKRGDIVVFRYPPEPKTHYVKRCVAIGGDEIIFVEKKLYIHFQEGDNYIKETYPEEKIVTLRNKLWVENPYQDKYPGIGYEPEVGNILLNQYSNGQSIDMVPTYISELISPVYTINDIQINAFYKKVEDNHYYMIGDNRDNSNDSRFWGSVPYDLVEGKPWFIYFSWDDDYKIRWNRMGHFIDTIESDTSFIDPHEPLD